MKKNKKNSSKGETLRLWRRVLRILRAVFILVALALLVLYFSLSYIVETRVLPRLAKQFGITYFAADVRHIGIRSVDIAGVEIGRSPGGEKFKLESLRLDYRFGRGGFVIENMAISGAHLDMSYSKEGVWAIAGRDLDEWRRELGIAAGNGDSDGAKRIPIQAISLEFAELALTTPEFRWNIPLRSVMRMPHDDNKDFTFEFSITQARDNISGNLFFDPHTRLGKLHLVSGISFDRYLWLSKSLSELPLAGRVNTVAELEVDLNTDHVIGKVSLRAPRLYYGATAVAANLVLNVDYRDRRLAVTAEHPHVTVNHGNVSAILDSFAGEFDFLKSGFRAKASLGAALGWQGVTGDVDLVDVIYDAAAQDMLTGRASLLLPGSDAVEIDFGVAKSPHGITARLKNIPADEHSELALNYKDMLFSATDLELHANYSRGALEGAVGVGGFGFSGSAGGSALNLNGTEGARVEFDLKNGVVNSRFHAGAVAAKYGDFAGDFASALLNARYRQDNADLSFGCEIGGLTVVDTPVRGVDMKLGYRAKEWSKRDVYIAVSGIPELGAVTIYGDRILVEGGYGASGGISNATFRKDPEWNLRLRTGSAFLVEGELEVPRQRLNLTAIGALSKALKGWQVDGEIGVSANYSYGFGVNRGSARLEVEGADIANEERKLTLTGLNTSLAFENLPSLVTSGRQNVSCRKIEYSGLNFSDFAMGFRVSPSELFIEQAEIGWCGGNVYTYAVTLGRNIPGVAATIYCDGLILSEFINVFGFATASGSGRVFGRVPVTWDGKGIHFARGYLYSEPGVPESFRLFGLENTLGMDPGNLGSTELDIAVHALKNFLYDWVRVNFETVGEDMRLSMIFSGRPAGKLPFGLGSEGTLVRAESPMATFKGIELTLKWSVPLNRLLQLNDAINRLKKGFSL